MKKHTDSLGSGVPGEPGGPGIPRKTAADLTADWLRDKILRGEYAEGAPLRQDAIAAAAGVSHIPVREALRQLEAEGLATFNANCGAVVSSLSLEEIQELFEVRAILEGELIRRSVRRLTPEALDRADAILDAYEAAFESGDVAAWGALNWRFHSTLLSAANRPLTMGLLVNLHNQSDRYTRMQIALTHGESRAAEEHRAIAAMARKRDVSGVHRLLTEHILSSGASLIESLRVQRSVSRPSQSMVRQRPTAARPQRARPNGSKSAGSGAFHKKKNSRAR